MALRPWVLEGRALQDVLVSPPRGEPGRTLEYATTIRFYDPAAGTWHVTFISPVDGQVERLEARPLGDRILLEGKASTGGLLRWSLSEIERDALVWRGELSPDGGETWHLKQLMRARRGAAV